MSERPQIWFGPLDPWSWEQRLEDEGPIEFYDLFTADARWTSAAAATHVVRLYPDWLEHYATPEQVRTVIGDLHRRNIAYTFETGPLSETPECNAATVEGFSGAGPARAIAERVRQAGGTLYGIDLEHGFDAATFFDVACRMSPTEIATDVVNTIEAVRAIFPDVKVGSIETANLDVEAVARWLEAYRQVTGEELDYFHLDVNYLVPDWAVRARQIEEYVRGRGIEFGIIYFGDAHDTSDAAWLAKAEDRIIENEVIHGGRPDHAVFQSWHPHPRRLLPETEPGTFTNLVLRYLRERTALDASFDEGVITGSLSTSEGEPVTRATVLVGAVATSGPGVMAEYFLKGTVPEGVVAGNVGYRINTECECSGTVELLLEEVRYTEDGSPDSLVPNGSFARGWEAWGAWGSALYELGAGQDGSGQALRVSAMPGLDAGLNSGLFEVTPGTEFELVFLARVSPGSQGAGYFHIIFHDTSGEVQRLTIPLQPGHVDLGQATTGPDGRFQLPASTAEGVAFVVVFDGDDSHWPAQVFVDD
ncbi:MAG: hypothetical protein ACLGHX_08115 [Acidimicrobiia bacterium]